MIEINWLWLGLSYGLACTTLSIYTMFKIYLPVVDEVKYIVLERFGDDSLKKTKRFSFLFTFIAFILVIVFAPFIAFILNQHGLDSVIKSYKNQLWLDVRKEILADEKKR